MSGMGGVVEVDDEMEEVKDEDEGAAIAETGAMADTEAKVAAGGAMVLASEDARCGGAPAAVVVVVATLDMAVVLEDGMADVVASVVVGVVFTAPGVPAPMIALGRFHVVCRV